MEAIKKQTLLDFSPSEDDLSLGREITDLDIAVAPTKPHFLDYDLVPPPGFEENPQKEFDLKSAIPHLNYIGEHVKIDKKYEKDGEISDHELAATGVTKKELFQQRKTSNDFLYTGACRKKHFLDENPIPPDYMMDREREHRSLDRNFERLNEYEVHKFERKTSLDREIRPKKVKEPSYTLSRFIEADNVPSSRGIWPVDKTPENLINYSNIPFDNVSKLGPKVECVYSLLSMLGSQDSIEISKKFLELSRTTEICYTLRRSGCIPLLVQMMHSDVNDSVRKRAAVALHNIVHSHPDDKAGRREAKVLRLIEQIMEYCGFLKTLLKSGGEAIADDTERHPLAAISSLMKVSFDEEHRHAMCQLGALQAIAGLVHLDHAVHGPQSEDQCCNSLRRYALMALTNLTFGDGNNKALLCANKEFMEALVAQLDTAPDDLLQVSASVLRNLSWRADRNMKAVLNEIGTVTALVKAAMKNKNENTLKAILSALWNLSAHCSTNKAEFCSVEGALGFLVDMLTYEGPSKTLKIIENAGGILRNLSSHIAVREDYRKILRQKNCLGILLQQLKSESLTVVSNACGTLWNLSARFPEDQKFLWDNGAVPMLRSLIHSKHKMISDGSSAALKNLLNFRPGTMNPNSVDPIARSLGLKELPTLNVRKKKALEQELKNNFADVCENLEGITLNTEINDAKPTELNIIKRHTRSAATISKSESHDSIISAKSDSVLEKLRRDNSAPARHETKSNSSNHKLYGVCSSGFMVGGFEVEQDTELPIDYSAKYNENSSYKNDNTTGARTVRSISKTERNFSSYQETDLDQPTDFSLRYAENQVESDADEKPSEARSNEIILILEDSVKCYETEGTPYIISNAASVSDLRNNKIEENSIQNKPQQVRKIENTSNTYCFGSFTPEKPIHYCEEGTPGYFSRYDSSNSLDELAVNGANDDDHIKREVTEETDVNLQESRNIDKVLTSSTKTGGFQKQDKSKIILKSSQTSQSIGIKINNFVNSAQETPLMFSRRSSMDSITSVEPNTADDKSSVVSDFSRLASGVISPSELPDSPTQSMPQSPRRNSNAGVVISCPNNAPGNKIANQRLRSVFEDDVNTFLVENTPRNFSCATSLSNLSLEDEPKLIANILLNDQENSKEKVRIKNNNGLQEINENLALSDAEEETDDKMLLATCINIGMNRNVSAINNTNIANAVVLPVKNTQCEESKNNILCEDTIKQYYTEDTPALLSKVGSNSNLSAISISTSKCDVLNLSDESSNASDEGNELLEQCIRVGMQKPLLKQRNQENNQRILQKTTENPIDMLRRGGLPPYLAVHDEPNRFIVEDSPCNFSIVSGLSDLTVGSNKVGPAEIKSPILKDSSIFVNSEGLAKCKIVGEDSLSSISNESEDDNNLLNQAIEAGCNKTKKSNIPTASMAIPSTSKPIQNQQIQMKRPQDDSFSSVDSSDSNDYLTRSLLEQCIRSGMNKSNKNERVLETKATTKSIISPKRSHLPMANTSIMKTPLQVDRERQRERERKDEQILKECIITGIAKNVKSDAQIKPPSRHLRQILQPTEFSQRFVADVVTPSINSNIPKNGVTTSVAAVEQQQQQLQVLITQNAPISAPDVEMRKSPDGISNELKNQQMYLDHHLKENTLNITGFECINDSLKKSFSSINLDMDDNLLEQSNEYPALKTSGLDGIETSGNESSFTMDVSNEFLIEKEDIELNCQVIKNTVKNKHKDPDLMLKSVERLTHELVSTAEYLRTTTSNDQKSEILEMNVSRHLNVSLNEDTCPKDISFQNINIVQPSVDPFKEDEVLFNEAKETHLAQSNNVVPKSTINKDNDGYSYFPTNDDLNSFNNETTQALPSTPDTQPNSLETETDTLVSDEILIEEKSRVSKNTAKISGINFQVGGEVHTQFKSNIHYIPNTMTSIETSSSMTNSTIIANEAQNLVFQLMENMSGSTTSLDIENIRPPSEMDYLSVSGCFEMPQSLHLSKIRKKALPVGLMARRAIGNGQTVLNSSVESVNSSCNLENIKPPSVMDELLDSMISVESIASEVVDNSLTSLSLYESACNDNDVNITLLESCVDNNGPSSPSDFSSAESTPRKIKINGGDSISFVKRTLTPKQKRRVIKERFKTYTVTEDFVLNNNISEEKGEVKVGDDEILKIEFENAASGVLEKANSRGECSDDKLALSVRRRLANPERFKTQTIIMSEQKDIKFQKSMEAENDMSEMSSICELKKRFKYINDDSLLPLASNSSKLNEDLYSTFVQTNAVCNSNSIDYDQNSETESCQQNNDDISPEKIAKPKIVKPVETSVIPNEEIKVVKGRKKSTYISPYRKSIVSKGSISKSQKTQASRTNLLKVTNSEVKKSVAAKQIPKNRNFIPKNSISKGNPSNQIKEKASGITKPGFSLGRKMEMPKSATNNSKIIIDGNNSTSERPLIERQGTFVKDTVSNEDIPNVTAIPILPIKKSIQLFKGSSTQVSTSSKPVVTANCSTSRLKFKKGGNTDFCKKVIEKSNNWRKLPEGIYKSTSATTVPQRSNSNTSLRTSPVMAAIRREMPSTNPPSRSNSNLTGIRSNVSPRPINLRKRFDGSKEYTTTQIKVSGAKSQLSKLVRSSNVDDKTAKEIHDRIAPNMLIKPDSSSRNLNSRQQLKSDVIVERRIKSSNSTAEGRALKRNSRLGTFISPKSDSQVLV